MVTYRRSILALAAGLGLLVLAGCEFPGAGVQLSFTSHQDGEHVIGSRDVTVSGQVTGGTADAFQLTLNGTPVTGASLSASTFTAKVTLADGTNVLRAAAQAAGFSYSATLHLVYPYLALSDGQDAAVVMGQTSFTGSSPATTQYGLRNPVGAGAVVGGRLYLPDTDNNRLVSYAQVPTSTPGGLFSILVGQTLWTENGASTTVTGNSITGAATVADDHGELVVADSGNNRVLLFGDAPTLSTAAAAVEVGQPGMNSTSDTSCANDRLDAPMAATVAGGRLIVADTGHNRVMIWNGVPTTSGAPADLILGRSDCAAGSASAVTLSAPSGVWSDGTRLLVADTGNNRVLLWSAFPTSVDKAADVVIGQADMSGSSVQAPDDTGPSALVHSGLSAPSGVDANGNQIFIADTGHNRVLVFDGFPSADGARADRVLGQTSLAGAAADAGGIGAATLDHPQGVRAFDDFLIVADTGNSRELRYDRP